MGVCKTTTHEADACVEEESDCQSNIYARQILPVRECPDKGNKNKYDTCGRKVENGIPRGIISFRDVPGDTDSSLLYLDLGTLLNWMPRTVPDHCISHIRDCLR